MITTAPGWNWWEFISEDDARYLVEFESRLLREPLPFGDLMRVFIKGEQLDADRLPTPRERYLEFSRALSAALAREDRRLVAQSWHEDYFEMNFAISEDDDDFEGDASDWSRAAKIEIVVQPVEEDAQGWFEQFVLPDAQGLEQINDRPLVSMLLAPGFTDLTKPHLLEFDLAGPQKELDVAERELCARDFVLVNREPEFLCVAQKLRIDAIEISALTARLRRYGRPRGIELTGWSTAPIKSE